MQSQSTTHQNIQPTLQNPNHHQPDQYPVIVTSAKPTHHVPESSATMSFLGLVRHGLPVDLNEPPPFFFFFFLTFSFVVLESFELLR